MNLIIQPDDGLSCVIEAIRSARTSVDIMIFRCDRPELERALGAAVARGVAVKALIAHTNSEGERSLRKLELRLLDAGVTVARTSDDLVRYHPKYLLIDRERALVLGFNFTALDIRRSRSFGLDIKTRPVVQDVAALFDADSTRQPWTGSCEDVVVSPVNARDRLSQLIRGAKEQLYIYDPRLSDGRMIKLLKERAAAGVDVRILGRLGRAGAGLPAATLNRRLHVRAIIADRARAFIGSQSLRQMELDRRRELGVLLKDRGILKQMLECFEADWEMSAKPAKTAEAEEKTADEAVAASA